MSGRNIFSIFALLLLIYSIDMIKGNASNNSKKIQNNILDIKFSRKLDSTSKIIIQFDIVGGRSPTFTCNLYGDFIGKTEHPSRKFISSVNSRINGEIKGITTGGSGLSCDTKKARADYLFYFSQETNSLEDIFNNDLNEDFKKNLYLLNLTEFDISVITSFKNAFSNLPNLKIVIFPTDISTTPTDVTEMFKGCTSLTSVDLSMFDLTNCENFNEMINGCNALNVLILHDFNFKDENVVKNILSKTFNLQYLDIDGVKGAIETIQNYVNISESLKVCQSKLIIPSKVPICCDKYIDEFD